MANRAYLYASDNADYNDPSNWDPSALQKVHYDSRHTIPFAWFFFFHPGDVKLVNKRFRHSQWKEIKFFARREHALQALTQRRPLLLEVAASPYDGARIMEKLISNVSKWQGEFLLVEPSEVLDVRDGTDDEYTHCIRMLEGFDSPTTGAQDVRAALVGRYFDFKYQGMDEEHFERDFIGFTYW